jgi:ABC-2 type transport system permease protein
LPGWIVATLCLALVFVPTMPSFAKTEADLAVIQQAFSNPVMEALVGRAYGGDPTLGTIFSQSLLVLVLLLVAAMNILLVVRHTRAEEDAARADLLRALPTGRQAGVAAVAGLAIGLNLAVSLSVAMLMAAFRVESIDLAGSLTFGFALGSCGFAFASISLVIAQLVGSAPAAHRVAFVTMGVAYVLRAGADLGATWVGALTPFGLAQRTYPFGTNRWWPIVVLTALGALLLVAASVLSRGRDLGRGVLPDMSRHPSHASRWLAGEWGLIWYLNRGTILVWATTVAALAALLGFVMKDAEPMVRDLEVYRRLIGVQSTDVSVIGPMVHLVFVMLTSLGTIPIVAVAASAHAEEQAQRLEVVLSRSVSRRRLVAGYAGLILFTAIGMQVLSAACFWLSSMVVMADPISPALVLKVAFNLGASMIFIGGFAICLLGCAKRAIWLAWVYLAGGFLAVYLGGIVTLPRLVQSMTPLGLLRQWPAETFSWWPWLGLTVGGSLLAVLGVAGFRGRDVTPH